VIDLRLPQARLKAILDACASLRIAVIGDLGLDAYWYADMTRAQLSREAPLYGRPVVREGYTPGGGANVAWNLAALGVGAVYAVGVLGSDWRGDLLRQKLIEVGVHIEPVLIRADWVTCCARSSLRSAFILSLCSFGPIG